MWFLAIKIGLIGIAVGILIGNISILLLKTYVAYKVYPLRFNIKLILMIAVLGTSVAAAMTFLK